MKIETETVEEEIIANGNRKIVLAARIYAELKFKLTREAENLSISLSEHIENILLNKDNNPSEKEIANLKEIVKQQNDCAIKNNNFFKSTMEKLNSENAELRKMIETMGAQQAIFNNKRLLLLFAELKGQKDVVLSLNGEKFAITYNTTTDLLIAMIYSFQLKNLRKEIF